MGIRAYVAFALAVMLGTAFWIGEQFEWVGRGKARAIKAAKGGSFHALRLRPSYVVDLDAGRLARERGDLRWTMESRGGPQLAAYQGSLIALAGDKAWEDIDARHLAALPYAATSFAAGYKDSPVRRGTVLAVRTAEGRLAKFRFVTLSRGWNLDVQWVVYPPPDGRAESSPWLEWQRKHKEALAAYRARDYRGVIEACRAGIKAAARAGEDGPVHAQALIQCGGFLDLNRYAPQQVEPWLLHGIQLAESLGPQRIAGTLGSPERELHARGLRGLALLYREQGRTDEATRYFRAEEKARREAKEGR